MGKLTRHEKLLGELYQVAGLAITDRGLTEGQHERLEELLLDALSDPDRWTSRRMREAKDLALKPRAAGRLGSGAGTPVAAPAPSAPPASSVGPTVAARRDDGSGPDSPEPYPTAPDHTLQGLEARALEAPALVPASALLVQVPAVVLDHVEAFLQQGPGARGHPHL